MSDPISLPLFLAQTHSPTIFTYFGNSNFAGKMIVLALILFSLAAWTVMIGKYIDLSRLRSLNFNFEGKLREVPAITGISLPENAQRLGPYANLAINAISACENTEADTPMNPVENALQRAVAQQTVAYESKMVFLASIVTGAPFLGLLGTVWGVMDAFGSMNLQSAATLQNLAPGVSGALLTTVAALLVAIPSVFGYNFLLARVKIMITELENFASSLADRFEQEL